MNYGDIALAGTVDFLFGTAVGGVPTTLVGGVLSVYAAGTAVEITAGVTLTADYDSKVGQNRCVVVATSGNGFAAGVTYTIVVSTGTLGGTNIAPAVIAVFSIGDRVAQGANANADAYLDRTDAVEPGLTPREAMRLGAAADAGLVEGAGTPSMIIKSAVTGTKDRITATTTGVGNRTQIVLDLTD